MQRQSGKQRARINKRRLIWARPWRILLPIVPRPKSPISSSLLLTYGFALMIILGAALLLLPMATRDGQTTSVVNALFTSASAVCVTGLAPVDTATHWSMFGQAVIMALIQIGGFGFMTGVTFFLIVIGRGVGFKEKLLIGDMMGISRLGGLIKISGLMALFTLVSEGIGAVIFYFHFSGANLLENRLWVSIFQSISAFNNAGFDLFGNFASLMNYQNDPVLLLTTAALIILGGISFLVIYDILRTRKVSHYTIDSKMVLSTSGVLLALGTIVILLTDFRNGETLGSLPPVSMVINAFFMSVSSRTAGFANINIGQMANYSIFFIMFLMFIGGASGSTAGGIKVNNFSMLASTIWSTVRGKEYPGAFGREFAVRQIHIALTVALLSLGFVLMVVFCLTVTESFSFLDLLFETVSAFSNTGLSTGITPNLSVSGKILITIMMFIGRLGPLTLMLALIHRQNTPKFRYPKELVRIG